MTTTLETNKSGGIYRPKFVKSKKIEVGMKIYYNQGRLEARWRSPRKGNSPVGIVLSPKEFKF